MIDKIVSRVEELEKETVDVCSNLVQCRSDHPEGYLVFSLDLYIETNFTKPMNTSLLRT